jgi:transposase
MVCACCGGALHLIGESVSETLDWIPAQLRVIRTTRPKYVCRACETVVQAPAPTRVIAGGLATPALLAHVLVSKYCDHAPLYQQSQIFARPGRSSSVGPKDRFVKFHAEADAHLTAERRRSNSRRPIELRLRLKAVAQSVQFRN